MSASQDYIWVVTASSDETQAVAATRGLREISEQMTKGVKLPVDTLKENFAGFLNNVIGMVSAVPEGQFPYALDEVEVSAEISGEGKIQLIGGISAGAKGGIKFKFKRV